MTQTSSSAPRANLAVVSARARSAEPSRAALLALRLGPAARRCSRLGSLLSLSLAFIFNCTPSQTQPVMHHRVELLISDGPHGGEASDAVDQTDRRIAVASEVISRELGEPLQFELDDTLTHKFKGRLHQVFVHALETLVTNLESMKRERPAVIAYAGPKLRTLRWEYTPSRRAPEESFNLDDGRLVVYVAAGAWQLLDDGAVPAAFERAWADEIGRRYADRSSAEVPVAEQRHYLEYLLRHRTSQQSSTQAAAQQARTAFQMDRLTRLLQLYPHLRGAELKDEVRAHLVHAARQVHTWFSSTGMPSELRERLETVHAAWIQWLNRQHPSLSDVQLREIATQLFTRPTGTSPGFGAELNVAALAAPRVRSWLERQQTERRGQDATDGANSLIVCPFPYDARTRRFSDPRPSCNGRLYTTLSSNGEAWDTLVEFLQRENAIQLTQAATLNLLVHLGSQALPAYFERLAQLHPEHAQAALKALAEFNGWGAQAHRRSDLASLSPDPLLQPLPKWWRQHSQLRPQLLYLLTSLGEHYEGRVNWSKLPTYLGAKLTQSDVVGFLEQSPRAAWHLRHLASSVSGGWSRSKALLPALERYLNEVQASGRGSPEPFYATERCVEFLCKAGDRQDITALQSFLRRRIESHPSEERYLRPLAERDPAQMCR